MREREVQPVHRLRAVTVGPPEARMVDVQRGRGFGIKRDLLRAVRGQLHLPFEGDVLDGSSQQTRHRLIADVFDGGLHGNVGGVGARQRQIGSDQRVLYQHWPGGGEKYFLPDAGVAVAHRVEPVPADGGEEGGPVDGGDAAVLADAIAQRVLVRNAGIAARGATSTATTA